MNYLDSTIETYDANPEGYMERTKPLRLDKELGTFSESLKTGAKILDAGCAGGRDSSYLANLGFDVIGIDLSDGLLAHARSQYSKLNFVKADVRKIPLADESVDGIWCHAVLLHLEDKDIIKALNEFNRVLKPGGKLFVSFKQQPKDPNTDQNYTVKGDRFFNYQTADQVTEFLQEAGLSIESQDIIQETKSRDSTRDLQWIFSSAAKI